jgi:SAM-dependent methyltransferase
MLPEMRGLTLVDPGCGYGWFCRWAREAGAATLPALAVSEKMLKRARSSSNDAAVTYVRGDLEHLDLPQACRSKRMAAGTGRWTATKGKRKGPRALNWQNNVSGPMMLLVCATRP